VTRRISLTWPDPRPFAERAGRPIRLLAASDEPDPALDDPRNRQGLGPLDAIVGCGDLEPEWLGFLGDAFGVPVVYVRGNHDHGGSWHEPDRHPLPLAAGARARVAGLTVAGLEWPGVDEPGNQRRDRLAWWHVLRVVRRVLRDRLVGRDAPILVISHAPPQGAGDAPGDPYHAGFRAYRWLLDRLRPPVWLHGHTTLASVPDAVCTVGPTCLVNVTGTVLVELVPPLAEPA
jgi:uncharacterized protein